MPLVHAASTTATTATSASTDGIIWGGWTTGIWTTGSWTSASSSSLLYASIDNGVWRTWNSGYTNYPATDRLMQRERYVEDPVALARRTEEIRIEGERMAKARERADKLLHECLSPEQSEELRNNGHFHLEVFSGDVRRRYRINRGRAGNVLQVDDSGRVLKRLCIHPIEMVPDGDTMLAQKLFLEGAEEEFLRVANHSRP